MFDAMAELASQSVPVVFPVLVEADRTKRTGEVEETCLSDYIEACIIGVIVAGASEVHLISEDGSTEEPVELNLTATCGDLGTFFYRTDAIVSASFRIRLTRVDSSTVTLSNGDQSFNVNVWRQRHHTCMRLNWDLSKSLLDRVRNIVGSKVDQDDRTCLPCLPASSTTTDFLRKRSSVSAMCTFCGGPEVHIETCIRFYRQIASSQSRYLILCSQTKSVSQSGLQKCAPSRLAGWEDVVAYIRENATSWSSREARDRRGTTVGEETDDDIGC